MGIILLFLSFGFGSESCAYHFENGHNRPLQAVMARMRDYEFSMLDFVDRFQETKVISKYVEPRKSSRSAEEIHKILDVVQKYEKLLSHVIEVSSTTMMSPRIDMIAMEKREMFKQSYREAYVSYLESIVAFKSELESFLAKDISEWRVEGLRDILMEMHSKMGAAHNRF